MTNEYKTDIRVQERNNRLMTASPMMAAMSDQQDNYNDLCESMDMWAELDRIS